MGGVIFLSGISPFLSSSPASEMVSSLAALIVLALAAGKLSNDPLAVSGLDTAGRLPLRIRLRLRMLCRSEMTRPACGAAITIVPGLATGAGSGESDRKSGWMCDSLAEGCCVKERLGGAGSAVREAAGLKLRLRREIRRGASRSNSGGIPGLGLRLVVGDAGMVSRKRLPETGDVDSSTVWRHCGSTLEVSHESKLSSVATDRARRSADSTEGARLADRWLRWLRWLRRLFLPESRWLLEVIGRTAFVKVEAMVEIVSVAEKPPLEGGGVLESIDTVRDVVSTGGVVRSYGTAFTRLVACQPISCIPGVDERLSSCARSARSRVVRKNSCAANEATSIKAVPARYPELAR